MEDLIQKIIESITDIVVSRVLEKVEHSTSNEDSKDGNMKLYTSKQLCEMLHISKSKLYRHREKGYLVPAKYVGRTPLYDDSSINNYLNNFNY